MDGLEDNQMGGAGQADWLEADYKGGTPQEASVEDGSPQEADQAEG